MECVGIGFVVLVVAILWIVYVSVRAQSRIDVWNQSFAWVARRFGGQLSLGGWFRQPQWRLLYGETFVRLATYQKKGGTRLMELIAQFPDARCRLEMFPRSADPLLFPVADDLLPLPLGEDDFGLRWTILTSDAEEAKPLLTQQVRFHLEQLRRNPDWSDVNLSIRPGWLTIRRRWNSRRPADLETFVELSLGLLDQALLTRTSGIDFVGDSDAKTVDDARCLVCGEGLMQDLVYCRRCKTPHHRECWEYSGGCSTYGCRETQFLVPQHLTAAGGEQAAEPLWPRPGKPR